jgi:2-C-methyl-D-erythritol 4-phosphate cytidylyltransferase
VQCGDADVIVVHDAARPLASDALFYAVVEAVRAGADAAVPGLAITDTVKRVTHDGSLVIIHETVPRDELMTVQTPQAFSREALTRAHASSNEATDDAALVEAVGGRVVVVPGEVDNIKITSRNDLERITAFERGGQ